MMYVHETADFRDCIQRYGLQGRRDALVDHLRSPDARPDHYFDWLVPYLKRREEKLRIIAKVYRLDDVECFCFLTVLERKGSIYPALVGDPKGVGEARLEPLIDEEELRASVRVQMEEELKAQKGGRPETLPPPYWQWFESPNIVVGGANHTLIYESPNWISRMQGETLQDYGYPLRQAIVNEAERSEWEDSGSIEVTGVQDGEAVAFVRRNLATTPPIRVLFLLAPFIDGVQEGDLQSLRKEYAFLLEAPSPRLDDIAAASGRTYPYFLLAEHSLWMAIERNRDTNLALSAEEESLLASMSGPGTSGGMPVFINGRAGSGKSTMLLYLFADYCARKLSNPALPGKPLYMTYSEELVRTARESVQSLLQSHHSFATSGLDLDPVPDEWFQPFRRFVLENLPPTVLIDFRDDRRIDFHRFKALYRPTDRTDKSLSGAQPLRLPEGRRISPETSWYVIRTFLKGYHADRAVDPQEYANDIPRSERSIDPSTFERIYETIWSKWYQPLTSEAGWWDDQDLVRAAINHPLPFRESSDSASAIFCDEAQDFTRSELRFLLTLSPYSSYDLRGATVSTLPFAFAGDPFQTLNPTGFRWEAITSTFYDELIAPLGLQSDIHLNTEELYNNYRSTRPIVEVLNLIQLWRRALFGHEDLQAQDTWDRGLDYPEPVRYVLGENLSPHEFLSLTEDTIIILPCEEGEEIDYIRNDDLLMEMFPSVSDEEPPRNVLSPSLAKGLEFHRVILYRFGDACDDNYWEISPENDDEGRQLQAEFFFNKLYVAASRAREHLFFVDSIDGDGHLWSHASDGARLEGAMESVDNSDAWRGKIRPVGLASYGASAELRDTDRARTAQELFDKGLASGNASLLRRAKGFFAALGDDREKARCEAHALEAEEDYRASGDAFAALDLWEDAWRCYWAGHDWQAIERWTRTAAPESTGAHRVEISVATFMNSPKSDATATIEFADVLREAMEGGDPTFPTLSQWQDAIAEFGERLARKDYPQSISEDDWRRLAHVSNGLRKESFPQFGYLAGMCFRRAGDPEAAVNRWESAGHTESVDYYRAKARTVSAPGSLEWYLQARDLDRVIELWTEAGRPRDEDWLGPVVRALNGRDRTDEAVDVYLELGDLRNADRNLRKLLDEPPTSFADLACRLIDQLLDSGEIAEATSALGLYESQLDDRRLDEVRADLARAVAYGDRSPSEWEGVRHPVSAQLEKLAKSEQMDELVDYRVMSKALEQAGVLITALRFYERLAQRGDRDIRTHARERWLIVKRQQIEREADGERATEYRRQRANRASEWGYREDVDLPEQIPLPPRRVTGSAAARPAMLGSLEIRSVGGRVRITDTESLLSYLVDFGAGQVTGDGATEQIDPRRVRFGPTDRAFNGTAHFGEDPRVVLELEDGSASVVRPSA